MEINTAISSVCDDELMRGILAAEQSAFNELYARHHLLLRKIIGQVLCSDSDAEETVQDVFIEIWNRAANFDPAKGKALGWIICMARRRALDRLRRCLRGAEVKAVLKQSAEDGVSLVAPGTGEASGENHLAARDLRRALNGLIEVLPS